MRALMKRRHRVSDVCGGLTGGRVYGVRPWRDGDGGCRAVLPPLHVGVIYGITDATAAAVDGQNV